MHSVSFRCGLWKLCTYGVPGGGGKGWVGGTLRGEEQKVERTSDLQGDNGRGGSDHLWHEGPAAATHLQSHWDSHQGPPHQGQWSRPSATVSWWNCLIVVIFLLRWRCIPKGGWTSWSSLVSFSFVGHVYSVEPTELRRTALEGPDTFPLWLSCNDTACNYSVTSKLPVTRFQLNYLFKLYSYD